MLVFNIGSTGLKAASYAHAASPDAAHPDIHETGRIVVESILGSAGTLVDDVETLLAQVVQHFSSLVKTPDIVVHRIVHGGDRADPTELTPETLVDLANLSAWAPLHQPPALALVGAAIQRYPSARQIGVFDSSWHQTMPQKHRVLAIPYSLYARGVKRYGFHGLAFQSAMRQLSVIAPPLAHRRIVLAHLGGGSSLCAVLDGKSVNTTMGMTPLGGIPMATRSGSLDPGVLLHLQRGLEMSPDEIDRLLLHESGLKGISAESGDMRELLRSPTATARRAVEVYVAGVAQGIAAMAACIGGIDVLAFSGGVGIHAAPIRASVVGALGWMGLAIDDNLNQQSAAEVSHPSASVRTFVLPVDEELEMAEAVFGLND